MVTSRDIEDWIDSVRQFVPTSKQPEPDESGPDGHGPLAKRPCYDGIPGVDTNVDTFVHPYDAAGGPLMISTEDKALIPQKPGNDGPDDQCFGVASEHPILEESRLACSLLEQVGKRAGTRLESRESLALLEKPVLIKGAPRTADQIPEDIRDLYRYIQNAALFRQHIVPHEVRRQVEQMERRDLPDSLFGTWSVAQPSSDAYSTHFHLCRIIDEAEACINNGRTLDGWNYYVHTPLLNQVFMPGISGYPGHETHEDSNPVVAEFDIVRGATIAGTAIPWMSGPAQPKLACSVSLASVDSDDLSVAGSSHDETLDHKRVGLDAFCSRRGTKYVDYVVLMNIGRKEPLLEVIDDTISDETWRVSSVNHTVNAGLLLVHNPIAMSIATELTSSREDPLIRLGLWTAAWHKHMKMLHDCLHPPTPQSYLSNTTHTTFPKLVSVPLIEVLSDDWFMYFACDSGIAINIYGPVKIGSTSSIIDIYALWTCLKYVKQWVEAVFYEAMQVWFMDEAIRGEV